MGLFRTFFYNDMLMIYKVYSFYILDISLAYHYIKRYETNRLGIDLLYRRTCIQSTEAGFHDKHVVLLHALYFIVLHTSLMHYLTEVGIGPCMREDS